MARSNKHVECLVVFKIVGKSPPQLTRFYPFSTSCRSFCFSATCTAYAENINVSLMLDGVIYVRVAVNQIDRMHQLQTSKFDDVFMILIGI